MNYLTSYQTLNDAFRTLSKEVLINGKPQQAVITTAYLGQAENRHISSLEPFGQGDYVEHEGKTYLVIEEVETKRHNKYRATMTVCNYSLEQRDVIGREQVGRDALGKPVYENIYGDPYYIWAVLHSSDMKSNLAQQIPSNTAKFLIDVPYSEKNVELFALNAEFPLRHKKLKITGYDITRDGILTLEAQRI